MIQPTFYFLFISSQPYFGLFSNYCTYLFHAFDSTLFRKFKLIFLKALLISIRKHCLLVRIKRVYMIMLMHSLLVIPLFPYDCERMWILPLFTKFLISLSHTQQKWWDCFNKEIFYLITSFKNFEINSRSLNLCANFRRLWWMKYCFL